MASVEFKLLRGRYLRILDKYNWIVAFKEKIKKGEDKETVEGYFPNILSAWHHIVEDNLLSAKTNVGLGKIVKQIRELRKPYFTNNK